ANPPELIQYDPGGKRIDYIKVSAAWQRLHDVAATEGIVATAYERKQGEYSRLHQFIRLYLFHPSSAMVSCPLAMTDGAAKVLESVADNDITREAFKHLCSRNPHEFWTSGQWMTEANGGSDVGLSESVAVQDDNGDWLISGRKWFTSAATSQIALTLARPEGNPTGGSGLALFYLETRNSDGGMNGIRVARLKDKLGTRKVPTAELLLDRTRARLVGEARNGVRQIVPMLTMTRTWNSVCAAASMRRGLALACDYATRREAFGRSLSQQPLHVATLARLQAEAAGALVFCFRLTDLIGLSETDGLSSLEEAQLRLLTSLTKLTTGRQAVAVASEVLEAFGGAGYVEDTGIPVLLRDSQVMPIWEGTTNVLSLDFLRALDEVGGTEALIHLIDDCQSKCADPELVRAVAQARDAASQAQEWLSQVMEDRMRLEAGARRLAITLGRSLELALLCEHAQWAIDNSHDRFPADCALVLAANGTGLGDEVGTDLAAQVAAEILSE
ncbi:MAG: acyl-CoA dehydrogenase family protein, partial [Gammaproteobacteria bacterium]